MSLLTNADLWLHYLDIWTFHIPLFPDQKLFCMFPTAMMLVWWLSSDDATWGNYACSQFFTHLVRLTFLLIFRLRLSSSKRESTRADKASIFVSTSSIVWQQWLVMTACSVFWSRERTWYFSFTFFFGPQYRLEPPVVLGILHLAQAQNVQLQL